MNLVSRSVTSTSQLLLKSKDSVINSISKFLISANQGFPNSIQVCWMRNFTGGNFFICWWKLKDRVWLFKLFSKLKITFCKYWTSINIKISTTCLYKEYEIKIKMVHERQWPELIFWGGEGGGRFSLSGIRMGGVDWVGEINLVWGFYGGVELFQVREWANFRLIGGEILANYSFNVI